MGLFDFVSEAGEKLKATVAGVDVDEASLTDGSQGVSEDRINTLRADSIRNSLAALDIEGEVVEVSVAGATAVLSGKAPSQEALEKMVLCAGNQHGIASVDCQLTIASASAETAAPATASAASEFYTVQSGDTLGKIAQQFYGSAARYTEIFAANQPMLTDPDKIYPGQTLRIPAASS